MQTRLSTWYYFDYLTNFHIFSYMRKLKRNEIKVRASDFPSLLYPNDGYDPDDVEDKLLRNPIAVRVSVWALIKLILLSVNANFFSSFVLYSHHQGQQSSKMVEKQRQRLVRPNSMA